MVSSPAKELIWDEKADRISGVLIEHDKKLVAVKAKFGVILASGGFSRNKKLLEKYVPRMANANAISGGGSQGDGLLMAQAYGADVADMPYIKATYGFAVGSKSDKKSGTRSVSELLLLTKRDNVFATNLSLRKT